MNVLLVCWWSRRLVILLFFLFACIQLLLDEGDTFSSDFMTFASDGLGNHVGVLINSQSLRFLSLSSFLNNSINLDPVFFLLNTFFNIHVFDLLGVEALSMMLLHTAIAMHLLDKADHRLVTFRVEVDVVACADSSETSGSITERIVADVVLNVVSEIGDEALTVVELNAESLIVNGTPGTVDDFTAVALAFGLAFLSLCLVSIEKHGSIDFFFWEAELVVSPDNLDFIWKLMSAKLISLKQIDGIDLRVDVEVPCAVDVVPEAMDGLVGTHRVEGVQVIQQAGHSKGGLEFLLTLLFHFR